MAMLEGGKQWVCGNWRSSLHNCTKSYQRLATCWLISPTWRARIVFSWHHNDVIIYSEAEVLQSFVYSFSSKITITQNLYSIRELSSRGSSLMPSPWHRCSEFLPTQTTNSENCACLVSFFFYINRKMSDKFRQLIAAKLPVCGGLRNLVSLKNCHQ